MFAALAGRTGAVWLDSGAAPAGWSIVAWDPVDVVADGAGWPAAGRDLGRPGPRSDDVPFATGVIGYLGYGAGHRVEAVPAQAPTPEPEVWLGRYDGALCFRHADRTWHPAGTPARRRQLVAHLAATRPGTADAARRPVVDGPRRATTSASQAAHEAAVAAIRELIAAGDCYQVNLTRAVHVPDVGDALAAYLRLRDAANAAYGAFLRLSPELAILSSSPELFLDVRGDRVCTDPIKGTRPRDPDPARDAALVAELEASPKERAELAMIVDLMRNDLHRVAIPGTVRAGARRLEAHPTVHHASQEVHATLAPGRDAWDALAACFPPGSVTGAPKVRACTRIAELEAAPRGVYCGAIGYAADGGRAAFNVAIRTAVWHRGHARFHVGGGIVADSDPAAEWWETVHKGAALGLALAGAAWPDAPAREGAVARRSAK